MQANFYCIAKRIVAALLLLGVDGLGHQAAAQQRPQPGAIAQTASAEVSAPIAARIRAIAEGGAVIARSKARGLTLFVDVERLRIKGDRGEELATDRYITIHYRYADDTALVTIVDLGRNSIVEVREVPHMPTRLTGEELERARDLALRHAGVHEALGELAKQVVVEPLVVRTADERDPWFGHRVVRLLFRVGRDYLSHPIVHVDLTTGEVHLGREGH